MLVPFPIVCFVLAFVADILISRGDTGFDAGERETVLRWLTREELAAAEAAIDDERFDVALRACAGARQMDAHGAYAALLQATALFGRVASGGVQGADEIERMLDGALKSAKLTGA